MSKVAFNKWLVKCPVDYDASDSFEKEAGDEENYAVIVQYMFFTMWDDEKETEDKEETEDYIAKIELSAKGVQQEHGISFEDACWVVDKMRDSIGYFFISDSEDYFVDEIKGKNEGRN
jgi:hypothetical protein